MSNSEKNNSIQMHKHGIYRYIWKTTSIKTRNSFASLCNTIFSFMYSNWMLNSNEPKNKIEENPKNKYQKLLNIIKDCLRNTTSTNPMSFQKHQQQNVSKENKILKQIEVQRIDKIKMYKNKKRTLTISVFTIGWFHLNRMMHLQRNKIGKKTERNKDKM